MSLYKKSDQAYNLFDATYFPISISKYISLQTDKLIDLSTPKKAIIEIGCGKAEHAKALTDKGLFYFGVDPVETYISKAQTKLSQLNIEPMAKVCVGDACNLSELVIYCQKEFAVKKEDILVFYPFNCIGNFNDITSAMTELKSSNVDFLISCFDATPLALQEREKYYKSAGHFFDFVNNAEIGHIFSDNFGNKLIGYKRTYLENLLKQNNISYTIDEVLDISLLIYSSIYLPQR